MGCALGFVSVNQQGVDTPSTHKVRIYIVYECSVISHNFLQTLGQVLLGLYLAQCALGAFIHYVKIPFRFGRPPQNYAHALIGLVTIALALYQVRLGYKEEWPTVTGRGPVVHAVLHSLEATTLTGDCSIIQDNGVNILWIVWVVVSSTAHVSSHVVNASHLFSIVAPRAVLRWTGIPPAPIASGTRSERAELSVAWREQGRADGFCVAHDDVFFFFSPSFEHHRYQHACHSSSLLSQCILYLGTLQGTVM